jgi:hypothetical protein
MAATQTVQIVAVDKTARVLGSVNNRLKGIGKDVNKLESGFGNLQGKILAVGAALGGAFGIRKILQVSSEVEQLGLRFQFLFGSVEEGNKAFDELLDYASRVPFTLEQIQQGAGNLAVISDNAEELGKNLELVGNVAAVTGLDFKTVSEQIQRSFSGGIAAAEIFRERGVRALLGFSNGAKVTAAETEERFNEVFGPNGPFGNAAAVLANTYEGVLSMIQDKIFKFTLALGRQGGLFDFAKGILGAIDQTLNESFGSIEEFAANVGQKLIEVTKNIAIGTAQLLDTLTPVFNFIAKGVNNLIDFANMLPSGIKALGIVGFLALGLKGKLIVIAISSVFDKVIQIINGFLGVMEDSINFITDKINGMIESINAVSSRVGIPEIPLMERIAFGRVTAEGMKKKFEDVLGVFSDDTQIKKMGEIEAATTRFISLIEKVQAGNKAAAEEQKKILQELGLSNQAELQFVGSVEKVLAGIRKQGDAIKGLTVDQQVSLELEKLKLDEMFAQADVSKELLEAKKAEIEAAVRQNVLLKERKTLENELRSLSGSLGKGVLDKFDPEKARMEKSLETLEQAKDQKLLSEEEYLKAREALNKQYNDKEQERQKQQVSDTLGAIKKGTVQVEDIEKLSGKQRLQLLGNIGKDLLSTLGQTNEKAFKLAKAVAIAEAVVNVARGISAALSLPFPFNLGAAALVAAQGYAQISAIKSSQYTGPREKGGPVGANQNYLVGESGPEILSMGPNAGTIIPNDQMGRDVTVNFNINTVDAEGFDELLIRRRSTITGIINNALTKQGKQGVIS